MKQDFSFQRASAFRARARTMLVASMLTGAAHWSISPLLAVERHWTGTANNLWSTPGNWNPAGAQFGFIAIGPR